MKLQITSKWIKRWEDKPICNDCDNHSVKIVTYPKLKPIPVCRDCYHTYYQKQILA